MANAKSIMRVYGDDPRLIPAYGIREAARCLSISPQTLQSWVFGRNRVIQAPEQGGHRLLSFTNLVEAHVLQVVRQGYSIPMTRVRSATRFISKRLNTEHPLALESFLTDGLDLFIENQRQIVNVSRHGQLALRDIVSIYLQRIEYDKFSLAARLYPLTRGDRLDQPRVILIDPRVSFGRPVVAGTGVTTSIIAERFKSGEATRSIAEDYGIEEAQVEEAVRFELQSAA